MVVRLKSDAHDQNNRKKCLVFSEIREKPKSAVLNAGFFCCCLVAIWECIFRHISHSAHYQPYFCSTAKVNTHIQTHSISGHAKRIWSDRIGSDLWLGLTLTDRVESQWEQIFNRFPNKITSANRPDINHLLFIQITLVCMRVHCVRSL